MVTRLFTYHLIPLGLISAKAEKACCWSGIVCSLPGWAHEIKFECGWHTLLCHDFRINRALNGCFKFFFRLVCTYFYGRNRRNKPKGKDSSVCLSRLLPEILIQRWAWNETVNDVEKTAVSILTKNNFSQFQQEYQTFKQKSWWSSTGPFIMLTIIPSLTWKTLLLRELETQQTPQASFMKKNSIQREIICVWCVGEFCVAHPVIKNNSCAWWLKLLPKLDPDFCISCLIWCRLQSEVHCRAFSNIQWCFSSTVSPICRTFDC